MKIPVLFAEATQVVFAQSDMQYGKVRYVQTIEYRFCNYCSYHSCILFIFC